MTARLPLTLAIMRALLARVGGETYAFPMAHVDETVSAEGSALCSGAGAPVIVLRGEALPFVRLRELVRTPGLRARSPAPDPEQHVIVRGVGRPADGGRRRRADRAAGHRREAVRRRARRPARSSAARRSSGTERPALIVDVSSLF